MTQRGIVDFSRELRCLWLILWSARFGDEDDVMADETTCIEMVGPKWDIDNDSNYQMYDSGDILFN